MICARFPLNILDFGYRHSISRSSLKYNSHRTMPNPRIVATELFKMRAEKSKKSKTMLNNAELSVVGSCHQAFRPSLMVSSEGRSYLFNCNEGFQRLCYTSKVRLVNLENTFLTNTEWSNVSGAFGLALTLQDMGGQSFKLRGSERLDGFFKAARKFLAFTTGIEPKTFTHLDGEYQDTGLKVTPIGIDTGSTLDPTEHKTKKAKGATKLVAYACLMPDLPGKLDIQKCRDLKIPIGPDLAKLKRGEDVTLPNGQLIKASEVLGPENQGFYFLVIECPSINQIDALMNNSDLGNIRGKRKPIDERQIDMLIHFSPESVVNDYKYRNWMDGFPDQCKHWLINHSNPDFVNFVESHRLLYFLGKIDKELFPGLHQTECAKKAIDKELCKPQEVNEISDSSAEANLTPFTKCIFEEMDKISRAQAFDKIIIRPTRILEGMIKNFSIDSHYKQAMDNSLFEKQLEEHQKKLASLPNAQEFEPELVFLGTGSAVPNKYRNTSCILFNLKAPQEAFVMLDCGEDSYGQLVRYYGPEKAKEVLKRLKMIYISHLHADHHVGLVRIIKARQELTDEPIHLLLPPGVEPLLDYHNKNFEDLSDCYQVYSTNILKSTFNQANEVIDRSIPKNDLMKNLNGLLKDFTIVNVDHCAHSCAVVFEFKIDRPGMRTFRLAYSGDARPCENFIRVSQGCDLLIHEATFDHRGTQDAICKKHSTSHEAIDVGRKMNAKFTILTHFTQRFSKIPYITDQFDEKVGYAFDFLTLRCPSHFSRLPMMKDLLQTVYDTYLNDLDTVYKKKEWRQNALQYIEDLPESR